MESGKTVNVVCLDLATYRVQLGPEHHRVHRLRRVAAGRLVERICRHPLARGRHSFSRGLLAIGTALARQGARVQFIHASGTNRTALDEGIRRADVICIYVVTPLAEVCLSLAEHARRENPHATIALGGPHIRTQGEHLLASGLADFVCFGWPSPERVAEALTEPSSRGTCPGIGYLDAGAVRVNSWSRSERRTEADVDYTLLPLPLSSYHINTTSSYGCMSTCPYCSEASTPRVIRHPDTVLRELAFLAQTLGAGSWVHFFDSTFTLPRDHATTLCRAMSSNQHRLALSCNVQPGSVTPTMAKHLHSANVKMASIGFETADEAVLRATKGLSSFRTSCECAALLKRYAPTCVVKANWMLGIPGTTEYSVRRDIDTMERLVDDGVVDLVGPKLFIPYPETHYYQDPTAHGLQIWTTAWGCYDRFHIPPPATPLAISRERLGELLVEAEERVLEAYCRRLAVSTGMLEASDDEPGGYAGHLYGSARTSPSGLDSSDGDAAAPAPGIGERRVDVERSESRPRTRDVIEP